MSRLRSAAVAARSVAILVALLLPTSLWARLAVHPAQLDIRRDLLPNATIIFRGRVVTVAEDSSHPGTFLATFDADRWYRGLQMGSPTLHFAYDDDGRLNGHNCIRFTPGSYWIVFANATAPGTMELAHDCHGGLGISGRLGPQLNSNDPLLQMEADFEAGVDDPDPAARRLSVQRVGNLKMESARPALRRALDSSTGPDRIWAMLAALKTGDITVLPEVAAVLKDWRLAGIGGQPQGMLALALRELDDRDAVPELLHILTSTSEPLVQHCVLDELGDRLRDPRALPAIASFLGSQDGYANHDALVGVWNLTHAPACKLEHFVEKDIAATAEACKAWWNTTGKYEMASQR